MDRACTKQRKKEAENKSGTTKISKGDGNLFVIFVSSFLETEDIKISRGDGNSTICFVSLFPQFRKTLKISTGDGDIFAKDSY